MSAPEAPGGAARRRAGLALAAPAGLLLFSLLFLPSSLVLVLSLTDYRFGVSGFSWIGLENYARTLTDPRIRQSLVNTGLYVGVVAPVSVLLALWIAVLIEGLGRLGGLARTIFFLPVTATLVALATAWEVVLHPSFGMVNVALAAMGLGKERFLTDPNLALGTLAFIGVWKMVGYNVLLYVAGLATIPRELYEAAAVDGADRGWARFATVTWPMLAPVTLFVTTITLIRAVSEFETVAVLTAGGPNGATEMILYTLYQEAFRYFDIGLASALAILFLAAVAGASILNIAVFDRRTRHG